VIAPTSLSAAADPAGGRIRISWTNPAVAGFTGTRLLRRELAFPEVPGDIGTSREIHHDAATPAGSAATFVDANLRHEVAYYYAVVSYDASGTLYPAFVSTMTTAPYETGAYLYGNLPGIVQSYDTALPPPSPALDPADRGKGQLRRFVEMFGLQFDALRSEASATRSFADPDAIEGSLLPLMASWIGWQTDHTLDLATQRSQLRHAVHYHATTGIAANLRATINRLVTWDVRIKEFAHNIFLSNVPEQFPIWEQERRGAAWQPAQLVTLDAAYEGKPSVAQSGDGRIWVFYHARENAPAAKGHAVAVSAADRFHLWVKVFEQDAWLPAHRLTQTTPITGASSTNRSPSVVRRGDGTFWIFWSGVDPAANASRLRCARMAAGRSAWRARIRGTVAAPFALADGDVFLINIGTAPLARRIVFRSEAFFDIAHATAAEVAAALDRELPGVTVSAQPDGTVQITSHLAGAGSVLAVPASAGATKLGLATAPAGADALAATLVGSKAQPFALAEHDTLLLTIDKDVPRLVTFSAAQFQNIAQAAAAEVAAAINAVIPRAARAQGGAVVVESRVPGADSMVHVDLTLSTAAGTLGLGEAPPATPAGGDETEPAAFEDAGGSLWLFWASRRDGAWKIWYDRLPAAGPWGAPRRLTDGSLAEREPSALFDPQGSGRIWVTWSRKKGNGLWNIFVSSTTTLDFNTQTVASWPVSEFSAPPATFDNREPGVALTSPGHVEVFFASNRTDGWNIWSRTLTANSQGADAAATAGQFSRRGPAPFLAADGRLHLWFRANDTIECASTLYPDATTLDGRYVGSTVADTRNPARLSLRNDVRGIQRYTYETPYADPAAETRRLYSRDTLGLYLTPNTDDEQLIVRSRGVIAAVLRSVLPIQVRAVFLIDQAFTEFVYTYAAPAEQPAVLIGERMIDTVIGDKVPPFDDAVADTVDFKFLKTWAPDIASGGLPDTGAAPVDLSFRLLLAHVSEQP
jgi:phage tail-like protein